MAAARTRGRGTEPTAKPRFDAYAGMLVLSLLAMIGGSVLLYLDYSQYEGQKPTFPPPFRAAAAAPQGGGQPGAPQGPGAPGGPAVPPPGGPGGVPKPPG